MSRLQDPLKVYDGYSKLGELEVDYHGQDFRFRKDEIRIHHLSPGSDAKYPPLAILKTIESSALHCKLGPSSPNNSRDLVQRTQDCRGFARKR